MNHALGIAGNHALRLTWRTLFVRTIAFLRTESPVLLQIGFATLLLASLWEYAMSSSVRLARYLLMHRLFVQGWYIGPAPLSVIYTSEGIYLVENAGYWVLGGFCFSAISACVSLNKLEKTCAPSVFVRAGRRPWLVVAYAVFCWLLFRMIQAAAGYASLAVSDRLQYRPSMIWELQSVFVTLMVAGMLASAGLTIPILVNNPEVSLLAAFEDGLKRIGRSWLFLTCMAGTFGLLGNIGEAYDFSLDRLMHQATSGGYLTDSQSALISLAAAIILECMLFAAFAALYRELELKRNSAEAESIRVG